MKLNDKLHLVIPVYGDGEEIVAYVHSAPVSREVFQANYKLIARTFSAIYSEGLHVVAGPRVAMFTLQEIAEQGDLGASALAFMNEVRRLSNVLTRGINGWESTSLQDAVDSHLLGDEDLSEVMNAIVFFTVGSAMLHKQSRAIQMDGAAKLWGARTSSLDFTAFVGSLGTSTSGAPIMKPRAPASSVPY
jgi:hypothetical protein